MALMLMDDLERVAAEVARVLAPGGVLACVVGGGAVGGEAYALFSQLVRDAVARLPETARIPALGDPRARSREGLVGVLEAAGFGPVGWETVPVDLSGPLEDVWEALSGIYDLGPMGAADVEAAARGVLRGGR